MFTDPSQMQQKLQENPIFQQMFSNPASAALLSEVASFLPQSRDLLRVTLPALSSEVLS